MHPERTQFALRRSLDCRGMFTGMVGARLYLHDVPSQQRREWPGFAHFGLESRCVPRGAPFADGFFWVLVGWDPSGEYFAVHIRRYAANTILEGPLDRIPFQGSILLQHIPSDTWLLIPTGEFVQCTSWTPDGQGFRCRHLGIGDYLVLDRKGQIRHRWAVDREWIWRQWVLEEGP